MNLIVIAHNLRSCHNVGSILRTAEGLGVDLVVLSGYTPYPAMAHDSRLPHLAQKIDRQISKTALGAEKFVNWEHVSDIYKMIDELKTKGFQVFALEQTTNSIVLQRFKPSGKLVLIVGREVEGIEPEVLQVCDGAVEIPMAGRKESFNVAQAAAMAMYHVSLPDLE